MAFDEGPAWNSLLGQHALAPFQNCRQKKHDVSFAQAQLAFADRRRVIAEDLTHSSSEKRYYCFGSVGQGILSVRFTYRGKVIRIIGAGYWRKGRPIYERENQVQGRTSRKSSGRT